MTLAVEAVNLTKRYDGAKENAVDNLNLAVKVGELFGLLGPNGAGKTTTTSILTTRVRPSSGKAFINGIDVIASPAATKRAIGVVPQSNTLDRSLSVFENLYFHGRYFGMDAKMARREAQFRLEQFRLNERSAIPVSALSGGMAQRLMVARAMLHYPKVLFLDEPTSGLDPQSRLALWDVLREIHANGQTIVLTTHYMEEAQELCERIAIMDMGKLLALGTAAELKSSTANAPRLKLITRGGADELAASLVGSFAASVKLRVSDQVITIEADDVMPLMQSVVQRATDTGIELVGITVEEPSLERVFIELTGRELRE